MELPTLPACRHRGPALAFGRAACRSPRLVSTPAGVGPETCRQCPYAEADGPPAARPVRHVLVREPARPAIECAHRGPPTGESRPWVSCHKDPPTRIPLHACAVHGVCTIASGARATACCKFCPDRTA